MKKNKLIILLIINFFGYELIARDSSIYELEKRVELLEKQVSELKRRSKDQAMETKMRNLKKGLSKIKIKKDIGNPDRVGKFLNGDEIWGFKSFTLKFDNKGQLKEWSKPF
ncbi:MAG: hypothetical protein CMG67_02245 [Candidatus Marinimicrobia bacterium]|nr:hypothetical protein [Candidatus Neomarinimicrobiota bacterium]|tara:strand:+ start:9265 stop:9597 length:333 start_codon:yes stop_codon:yes gene_type:complete